jgi:hypothetical protein
MPLRTLSFHMGYAFMILLPWAAEGAPDFNRDIRPILSGKCFKCHGPDANHRKAKLRLDTAEGAFAKRKGEPAIVAGKPEQSVLIHRITAIDVEERMPPVDSRLKLSKVEIELLQDWVASGAKYQKHWSLEPVRKLTPPSVAKKGWARNELDPFVLARLELLGLSPSPQAKRETLFRRVHLDLTGLPPSIEELDAFLADSSEKAFESTVDRILKSPHCAERLALDWLDVARYADTNGYSIDDHREMWAWRDWVIHAYLKNKPYDRFIIEQLAGDLLEGATEQQKVATGFLRNGMNTHEGGTIAEEYRVAYIADKIDTVSTAFMGLTMKCAQCHDHKYDPISQRDYYRFFAFFNNATEPGNGATNGNTRPFMAVSSVLQDEAAFQASLKERIASLEHCKIYPGPELDEARKVWEKQELVKLGNTPVPDTQAVARFPFPKKTKASWIWADRHGKSEWSFFRKQVELETLPANALMFVCCDNEAEVWVNGKPAGKNPDWRTPTVLNIRPLLKEGTNLIAVAGKDWSGGSLAALLALAAFWNEGETPTYVPSDDSWRASGTKAKDWNKTIEFAEWPKAFKTKLYGAAPWGKVFEKVGGTNASPTALRKALLTPPAKRSPEHLKTIADAFARTQPLLGKINKSIEVEIKMLEKVLKAGKTTVMVMDDKANRKTHMLIRGQYDKKGEIVTAAVPSAFGALPEDAPANRLALARWLTRPDHPLTARVTVNRYWQMLFGTGLVKTAEDFGSQGEWPSHPELLDWLAHDFVSHGWNVRRLLKQMVMSATWQQSSEVKPELLKRDPYNRLLARAPRHRLQAEFVRDSALSVSGLLSRRLGGPSVYPYQPVGLWKEVSHFGHPTVFTAQHFYPDSGQGLYRRSMYTFWKRTSPPPTMTAFDAPNRETCAARRLLTNTPLQALILLNDPQFVEAACAVAQRVMAEAGQPKQQIENAFRLATSRNPSQEETAILMKAFQRQLVHFEDARRRSEYLAAGQAKVSDATGELAAMTSVASLILNLDETITRE